MDAKITLSFREDVIEKAKRFAESNNMSLSRLTEMIYEKITSGNYKNLEELPIADWVTEVAEGETTYQRKRKNRMSLKKEFFKSRK